jgi:hypothetical protein
VKKKLLAASVGLISMVSAVSPLQAATAPFPDVAASSENAAAIGFLKGKGIIAGYPDGTFQPNKTINRAEALKLIFLARKALNIEDAAASAQVTFPDVKSKDWYYEYVQKAAKLGIVKGYEDSTFKPANEITAAESLKIMEVGLIPTFQSAAVTTAPFTDVTIDRWYAPFLAYAKNKFLIEAKGDGSYGPERKMTRAEFAEAIYRVVYTQEKSLEKYPLNLNWQYCNNFELGYKIKRPYAWEVILAGKQMIFWRKDQANGQVSFARVYPNSAAAVVAIDENSAKLSLEKYLALIDYGDGSSKVLGTMNGLPYASVQIDKSGLQDSYFQLANGKIVAIYAQTGDGILSAQLKEEILNIIGSVKESNSADINEQSCLVVDAETKAGNAGNTISTKDQLISELMKLVLVNGKAEQALGKLNDEIIIETDSIGIGTGPVDYYYSASVNLSLKIDRNSATVLASKTGKTSAF